MFARMLRDTTCAIVLFSPRQGAEGLVPTVAPLGSTRAFGRWNSSKEVKWLSMCSWREYGPLEPPLSFLATEKWTVSHQSHHHTTDVQCYHKPRAIGLKWPCATVLLRTLAQVNRSLLKVNHLKFSPTAMETYINCKVWVAIEAVLSPSPFPSPSS